MLTGVNLDEDIADTVAHLKGVKAAVRAEAHSGAARASAKLATHKGKYNKGGSGQHSKITVKRGDLLDWFVALEDPDGGALAIEFGRSGAMGRGGPSDGVHAVTGAW